MNRDATTAEEQAIGLLRALSRPERPRRKHFIRRSRVHVTRDMLNIG